ncbi:metallophosphoesterase family protein [Anaerobaca lacustris]|uniref:Metallophosphoesterase family protein n=1 Tax=Anaerobaca lacustris TaxID=3044600 RepID=A0AAW6TWT5_9BACT|nr:metallophosphoesterase family protein [Sedimentisphaerales bacterium M17dextr]
MHASAKVLASLPALVLFVVATCGAQSGPQGKPSLKFNDRGQFKIVQFTDLHLKEGNEEDGKTIALMAEVLDAEKPQLVVLTGDVLGAAKQVRETMELCAGPMVERRIPWAMTLGNHDDEGTDDRRGLMDVITSLPYSVSQHGPKDITGVGNHILPVYSADGREKKWILYLLDSNAYPPEKSLGKYDWIRVDQVDWYRRTSKELTAQRGGRPYPALAFFHIPLPEYEQALAAGNANLVGNRHEKVCCPEINSGFFAAMLECGDIKGTFVGHDHVNDYEATLHGIRLIYGRATGFSAYGRDGFPRGGRIILIEADKETFTTWIRMENGNTVQYQ